MKRVILLSLAFILSGCGGVSQQPYQNYLAARHVPLSAPDLVQHCHGYGCTIITPVELDNVDWKEISKIFHKSSQDAAQEREKIAEAIGLFERIVGARAGTDHDVMGTFRDTGDDQLDCVDESTNTTAYLSLLENEGLLKFHRLESPAVRLPIIHSGHWPHQSALIIETATGRHYVVDSWFHDNGAPADIIDLETWRAGWKPVDVRGINL